MSRQKSHRRAHRTGLAGFVVLAALVSAASFAAETGPRPISEAERAAAEIAAHYLAAGPSAIFDRLAAKSPLRTLSPEDAMKEIEVRAGPNTGAKWEMQTVVPSLRDRTAVFEIEYPSGVDEMLIIMADCLSQHLRTGVNEKAVGEQLSLYADS